MSITLNTLARIADDVYLPTTADNFDNRLTHQRGFFRDANIRGFQGGIYGNDEDTVVAFRGTKDAGGVTADIKLTFRVEPAQVKDAIALYEEALGLHELKGAAGKLIVCGHSLGGYLTQAICAIHGAWGCTFNAPGARSLFTGLLFGCGWAPTRKKHYLQEADEKVLNITIAGDVVSGRVAGKRIGKKIHLIGGLGYNAHGMGTAKNVVSTSRYGDLSLEEALEEAQDSKNSGY